MKTFLSFLLLASVAFVPTTQARPRATKTKGKARPVAKPRMFVLRETAKVGDKFVWAGLSETRVGGKIVLSQKQYYSEELVKKEGNKYTWRVTSGEQETSGNSRIGDGKFDNVEVETYVRNGFGNLISRQGSQADAPAIYGEWPEVPVRVGSTWKSRTVSDGKSYPNTHTLKAIKTVAGKEYLLITMKSESGLMPSQTKWFIPALHQSAKIEATDETSIEGGQKASFKGVFHLSGKNGRTLLP